MGLVASFMGQPAATLQLVIALQNEKCWLVDGPTVRVGFSQHLVSGNAG